MLVCSILYMFFIWILGFQELKDRFPIDIRDNDVICSNDWCHSTGTPPVVILQDLPHGVGLESVEMYLETQRIDVKSIDENDEDNSIIVKLNDPTGKWKCYIQIGFPLTSEWLGEHDEKCDRKGKNCETYNWLYKASSSGVVL